MSNTAIDIAIIRAQAKERKFDGSGLKANCVNAAEAGNKWIIMDPLQLFLLIDKIEELENNLNAVKNEIQTIEILSADVRRDELREKVALLEKTGQTVTIAQMREMFGV